MGDMTPAERIADLDDQLAAQEIMLRDLRDERDAAYAVIEQVRDVGPTWHRGMYGAPQDMIGRSTLDRILSTAPATMLAQVKANAWDEGYESGTDDTAFEARGIGSHKYAKNPYRSEQGAQ